MGRGDKAAAIPRRGENHDVTGNKTRLIEVYLSNNHRFVKTDPLYRKVSLLNALLSIMLLNCSVFVVVDIFFFKMYTAAAINAAAVVFALAALLYFRKTNRYEPVAKVSVIILLMCLAAFFRVTQNQHYGFVWLFVFPPIAYFLLNRITARLVTGLFAAYMLYFVLTGARAWGPAAFGAPSIFNIAGAALCLVFMISYYESSREDVWEELNAAILLLDESRKDLRLILDSSAEAIFGIDEEGKCTFCNRSSLEMLGYRDESELLGKNMHSLIHHTRSDGRPFYPEDCRILQPFRDSVVARADDEVFRRADGTSFAVEYFSYPKIKNGKTIGAVVTFMDISERKQKEKEILYLSCYDMLTGLQNRRCFEDNRARMDVPGNLPLSVIFADINGLKLTNDVFGHSAGDELIRRSSRILQEVSRPEDLVVRFGGDEFVLLLPKTDGERAEKILGLVRARFADVQAEAIVCSISLGLDTKKHSEQSLDDVMARAENAMYRDKALHHKSGNGEMIDIIIGTLHERNADEKRHSAAAAALCAQLGAVLNLAETEIRKANRAGYLHDIGKIVLDEAILRKDTLTDEEYEKLKQHPAVGYRILNLFNDTLDLAEYVYSHHERWDGTGYPRGLRGAQIPLLSRVIAIAETYERVLNKSALPLQEQRATALDVIRGGAGTQFDPQIAESFVQMMERENISI